jgi:two-component system, cell cycle sensor histidine kinase and response regulator CckA
MRMAEMMLKRLGYQVLAAGTPDQALALAAQQTDKIDLLMTDVVMPEMNGRHLAIRSMSILPQDQF